MEKREEKVDQRYVTRIELGLLALPPTWLAVGIRT